MHDYDMKVPFCGGWKQYSDFLFLFLNFNTVFRWIERDGISAINNSVLINGIDKTCISLQSNPCLWTSWLNTDTSLLRTVCFVPGERKPLHVHFLLMVLFVLNTDTSLLQTHSWPPQCLYSNGVWLYSHSW